MFGWLKRKDRGSGAPSIGEQAVKQIAKAWKVDEGDAEWKENGFHWWPGHFRVEVLYDDQPGGDRDDDLSRVSIETEYIEDVPAADPEFVRSLAAAAQLSSGYCFWYLPTALHERLSHEGPVKLTLVSTAYVHRYQLDWLPQFLAAMAVMQPITAEAHAAAQAQLFGGKVAYAPRDRVRPAPNKILRHAADVYVPAGKAPSWWSDTDEFERFAETFGRQDACFGIGQRDQMTLEAPFGSSSALLRFFSDEPHPLLGSGLLVTIQIPFRSTETEIAEHAALLNNWEAISSTGIPLLGSWHSREFDGGSFELAHSTFVPNALAGPEIALNLALWSLARVCWARETLWPDLKDLTMAEILAARMSAHRSS